MNKTPIKGLIAAPFTPMHQDGSINLKVIPDYYRQLKADGLKGAFVCGSAGEGVSMTIEERMAVAQAWRDAIQCDFKLLIHVGHTSYMESCKLAEHAQSLNADAVATIGPCFFKPEGPEDLAQYCAVIAQACPDTPFYYYHIPTLSGVLLSMRDFLRAALSIPNFSGIKFTSFNMYEYQQCKLVAPDRLNIMYGHDENIISGLALGSTGFVGSLFNQLGKLFNQILVFFNNGQIAEALELQHKSVLLVDLLVKYHGSVSCGKAIQTMIGIDCGPARLPLRTLSAEELSSLKKELDALDFFSWR